MRDTRRVNFHRSTTATKTVRSDHEDVSRKLNDSQKDAVRQILEEVYLAHRGRILWINFWRGVLFGFGSIVGGVILVAILVWILAHTINWFPMVHDFTQRLIDSLNKR